jgi:hypothetical protein
MNWFRFALQAIYFYMSLIAYGSRFRYQASIFSLFLIIASQHDRNE